MPEADRYSKVFFSSTLIKTLKTHKLPLDGDYIDYSREPKQYVQLKFMNSKELYFCQPPVSIGYEISLVITHATDYLGFQSCPGRPRILYFPYQSVPQFYDFETCFICYPCITSQKVKYLMSSYFRVMVLFILIGNALPCYKKFHSQNDIIPHSPSSFQ